MKRKDCFFGLHFDFHANADTKEIGAHFDEAVVARICEEVQPDFIQCDTKGHPGYSSYPTKVGTPAPHLVRDILAGWRRVTKEHGVLLFSHYSGLWDKKAMHDRPAWAAAAADGTVTDRASVFGGYADGLLIPQLCELAGVYGMDGAWVDGECWAQTVDYGERACAAWRAQAGCEPPRAGEAGYAAFLAFQRKAFFAYVAHYIAAVRQAYPHFEMTSNWLNTAWAPDDVCLTDYISGDLSPTDSVDSARFDGRIMQSFGRNWDIMSWGISFPVHHVKSAAQLSQEAAVILSLGGGFQIYNMQSPQDTVMDEWAIPIWAEVARFCRERQPFCRGGEPVPEVGLVYSPAAYYSGLDALFYRGCAYNTEYAGIAMMLCDAGNSVTAVHAERIAKGEVPLREYRLLAVSDAAVLEEGLRERLLTYAAEGGTLLLCGAQTALYFAEALGVRFAQGAPVVMVEGAGWSAELRTRYAKPCREGEASVYLRECTVEGDIACENPPPTITPKRERAPAFTVYACGKGKVAVLPLNIGALYQNENTFELRRFAADCLALLPRRRLYTDAGGKMDVLLTRKEGREYIHAVNLQGEHRCGRVKTFESIPPVYDAHIRLACPRVPERVTVQPRGEQVAFRYENGELHFCIGRLDVYDIFVIEY